MFASQNAHPPAYDALPRHLAILAALAVVSIGLMIWTFCAGLPETWRTLLLLLNAFANGLLVNHFILKHGRRLSNLQGDPR